MPLTDETIVPQNYNNKRLEGYTKGVTRLNLYLLTVTNIIPQYFSQNANNVLFY